MTYATVTGTAIEEAADWLRKGHLVAFPTETVYGLGGNALHADTVVRIFETKERPLYNPLIVHVTQVDEAKALLRQWPTGLDILTNTFWPGPLTLLLERNHLVPDLVTAGLDRVAIRIPDHPMALALIRACGFPLAAPSANLFSRISPTTAEHVSHQLEGRIPYILDGGPCTVGLESTIIGLQDGRWCIYRQGAVTAPDLEAFVGKVHTALPTPSPVAPGLLPMHYAPRTRLEFGPLAPGDPRLRSPRTGLLRFDRRLPGISAVQVILAPDSSLHTAARELYAALHRLDSLPLDLILAEPVPEEGLGRAINDRLQRAAGSMIPADPRNQE